MQSIDKYIIDRIMKANQNASKIQFALFGKYNINDVKQVLNEYDIIVKSIKDRNTSQGMILYIVEIGNNNNLSSDTETTSKLKEVYVGFEEIINKNFAMINKYNPQTVINIETGEAISKVLNISYNLCVLSKPAWTISGYDIRLTPLPNNYTGVELVPN